MIWKSAKLLIAFYRDKNQRKRRIPYLWGAKGAEAGITDRDKSDQETFVLIEDAKGARDIQIKFRPEHIVIRRDAGDYWHGLVITDHSIKARVAGRIIEIGHDGSVKSISADDTESDKTIVEADGTVFKWTDLAEIIISGDGAEVSHRQPDQITAITPRGTITKALR
jgi:hypothetical protein